MADGNKIRAKMDELGINSAQLSREMGWHPPHTSDVLNGRKSNLTEKTLYKLCDVLQCKPEDIR